MQARLAYNSGNPVLRIAAAALALVGLGIAVFLGIFIFAALVGLGALAAVVFAGRLWWLRRRMRRPAGGARPGSAQPESVVIEGEYRETRRQTDKS